MNIKFKIIKIQLELLRSVMHFLLNFNKPTDKIVIRCSQQLDTVIVRYHKLTADSNEWTVNDNGTLFINNIVHLQQLKINKISAMLIQVVLLVIISIYI